MKILFLKGVRGPSRDEREQEPLSVKMRRILQSHIDEPKTEEDREVAVRELRKFEAANGVDSA